MYGIEWEKYTEMYTEFGVCQKAQSRMNCLKLVKQHKDELIVSKWIQGKCQTHAHAKTCHCNWSKNSICGNRSYMNPVSLFIYTIKRSFILQRNEPDTQLFLITISQLHSILSTNLNDFTPILFVSFAIFNLDQ